MMSITATDVQSISPIEFEHLYREHGAGLSDAQLSGTKVKVKNLCIAPLVFQPRLDEIIWRRDEHVRELVLAANRQNVTGLAAINVFAIGGLRVVIDGHCRLEAYLQGDPERVVTVRHFKGTVSDALLFAAASNSQDKLPLRPSEKAEFAWRIVQFEEGRKDGRGFREIARSTGCGRTAVWKMQKTLGDHPSPTEGNADAWNPRGLPWKQAKRGERVDLESFSIDAWRDARLTAAALRTRKAVGDWPDRDPELVFEAMGIAYPRFAKEIQEEIASGLEEGEEGI